MAFLNAHVYFMYVKVHKKYFEYCKQKAHLFPQITTIFTPFKFAFTQNKMKKLYKTQENKLKGVFFNLKIVCLDFF